MKKKSTLYFLSFWMTWMLEGYFSFCVGQTKVQPSKYESIPGSPIIEYASDLQGKHRIPPPQAYINRFAKDGDTLAKFFVTYVGFEGAPEAKAAFQRAVDIWSSLLSSPVTIYVEANWTTFQNENVLGGANAATFIRGLTLGSIFPRTFTWYPIALAEKLAQEDINSPGEADIQASFNRNFTDWYFGLDGNPPVDKYDFVSVVLHELGHGLGFTSLTDFNNNQGSLLADSSPGIFDVFLEDNGGTSLLNQNTFPDPSTALGDALEAPLFFDAPIVTSSQGGRTALYSPSTYEQGSSTSHLDQTIYFGTINSLMTPFAVPGTSEHTPGPVTLQMFADMGWVNTFILPDTLDNTETVLDSYPVNALVFSDSTLDSGSITLHYSKDTFNTEQTILMQPTGNENEYTASIPGGVNGELIGYYITAKDGTNRTYSSPSGATELNVYFFFFAGTDNTPPTIIHDPVTFVSTTDDQLTIEAEIFDVFGIDEDATYLEYSVNNIVQDSIPMTGDVFDMYSATIDLASFSLQDGDSIYYRIISRDLSIANNQALSPGNGFYKIDVEGSSAAQNSYENDFNNAGTAAEDFFGNAFSVTTATGFSNGAINSEHPYKDGTGTNNESNYFYQLKIPVIISSTNPFMRFDEIVLVEPGETGSVFGDADFYDYVVVEGSKNGGATWKRFLNGYDARANSSWLSRYSSNINNSTGNSEASGTPNLYISRLIKLSDTFQAGDTVVFRFRLFADELVHGWGWAIDNLQIQGSVTALEDFFGSGQNIHLYPNPSRGMLSLEAELLKQPKNLELEVLNLQGQTVYQKKVESNQFNLSESLNLNNLSAGLYLMRIKTEAGVLTKRFVINK